MMSELTVYVVEHDPLARESVVSLIESVGLTVEAFSSCEEFVDAYTPSGPGCLVLDVKMPGMGGFELLEQLVRRGDYIPVIMISEFGDASMAVRALEIGAIDFITKPINNQLLLDRIRQGLKQDAHVRSRRARTLAIQEHFATLTPREQEVMRLVVAGKANKAIAAELGVSTKTVEGHRAHVMEKMGADSLAALVRMGVALESPCRNPVSLARRLPCAALCPQAIP